MSKKITIGIIIALVVGGGYLLFFHRSPTYQFVTVSKGSIVQSVSLTGNTTPTQSVTLTFGSGGIISRTFSDLGKKVNAGQVLAELNTSDLLAQLHEAQANLNSQKAKLEGLQNGSRPEDITLTQVALENSKTDLENTINNQKTLVASAFQTLLNSTLAVFPNFTTEGNQTPPTLSGTYILDKEGEILISASVGGANFTVSGLINFTGDISSKTPQPIGDTGLFIQFPANFFFPYEWVIPIPNKKALNYLANQNAYTNALQNQTKAVATAQSLVNQNQAELNLKQAGSLPTDIASQTAQVEQAQASVESATAKIENAQIVAPIGGTVTQFDAKVGQLASASVPLVSIMSSAGYEVDAGVSEIDIGKILVGDMVTMTLDAFPNETFNGTVFYIAPSATNTQGVISYQIKISFDAPDPRLKSGLTANIDIQTKQKDNVLILPQYAILQNDQGTFVEVLVNKKIKQNPVTLGIEDQKGNVEILSGVTEGEMVLNIGLKAQ